MRFLLQLLNFRNASYNKNTMKFSFTFTFQLLHLLANNKSVTKQHCQAHAKMHYGTNDHSQDHDGLQSAPCKYWRNRAFSTTVHYVADLLSNSGIDRITPLPVPTHRRLDAINMQLIRTKENPRLPVPAQQPNSYKKSSHTSVSCILWQTGGTV